MRRTTLTSALAAVLTAGGMTAPEAWADTARTAGVGVVAHATAGGSQPPRTALAILALAVIGITACGLALAQLYASRAAR